MYPLLGENWGLEEEIPQSKSSKEKQDPILPPPPPQKLQINEEVQSNSSPPPDPLAQLLSPAQIFTPENPGNPDDKSPVNESIAQGFPPVQLAPRVEQLHAGHLGEVK